MQLTHLKKCATILLTSTALLASIPAAFAEDYVLNILHINDLHSRIEPINRFDSTCSAEEDAEGKCFGGIARVKTKIDERRKSIRDNGGNVVVLDAGDQFQGSLFYSTYKGKAAAEFMNAIGFDVMAIGNHEFDDGPDGLNAFIDRVNFPVISGNTLAANNSVLAGKIPEVAKLEIGGQTIAIVSVLATDTDETSSPGNDILIVDEIAHLNDIVTRLEAEGINKIILVSHVGLPRDREIAAAVNGIDVIVGGHSHTLLSNIAKGAEGPYPVRVDNPAGESVPIVQAYAYSKYLGELRVTFNDEGKVLTAAGEPHLLDVSVAPAATMTPRIAELATPIEELKKEIIGQSNGVIEGDRKVCRAQECAMGNLVADAMLDRVKSQGVQIAIQNGGGLRATIDEGEVSMGDVLTVLPFQNTLATFQLKGADVVAALENGVSQIEEGAGRFPQVAGLTFSIDAKAEAGSRISNVMVAEGEGFAPIDMAKTYGVVSNNYMRGGGDGYAVFASNGMQAYDFGPGLEAVVADYLKANTPYTPYTDGRITTAMMAKPEMEKPEAEMQKEPKTEMAKAEVMEGKTHMIVKGDTYWDLAATYYNDPFKWTALEAANAGKMPKGLEIGETLVIPAQ